MTCPPQRFSGNRTSANSFTKTDVCNQILQFLSKPTERSSGSSLLLTNKQHMLEAPNFRTFIILMRQLICDSIQSSSSVWTELASRQNSDMDPFSQVTLVPQLIIDFLIQNSIRRLTELQNLHCLRPCMYFRET